MRTLPVLFVLAACEAGSVAIDDGTPTDDTDVDTDVDTDTDTDTDPVDPVGACDPYGASVQERLTVDHGSTVASSISLNTAQECGLDLRNGTVDGDVWVGPDGYPDVVICRSRSGELIGTQEILDRPVALTRAGLPRDLPPSGGEKIVEWSESVTFTVDRVFSELRARTRAEIVIDGDVDIYVTDTLELNNGTLRLTEGSELDLWVGGEAQVIWGSRVHVDGDPADLRIHLLDDVPLQIDHGSTVSSRVRAPASTVTLTGRSSRLVGTVQADTLSVLWGAELQVDPGLLCP